VKHSRVGSSLLSLVLLVLTSCGGSDGPGMTDPDPPRVSVINVVPDAATLSFLGATSTLVAHVRDQNGQPIAAMVSWSSDNTVVVTVNGSGLLTAVQNGTANVTASTSSLSDVVPVTVQQVPTQLEVISGGDQSGAVGQALVEAVVVRAEDAGGALVAGASLSFVVSSGGGTVSDAIGTTDAEGLASTTWTLGTVTGQQQLAVSVEDNASALLQVSATGTAAAPTAFVKSSGDLQTGVLSQPVPEAIVVQLQDEFGNGVTGQTVTFVVTSGGGTVSSETATTGASGLASTIWTMGSTAGEATLTATATGLAPLVFKATAVVPSPDLVAGTILASPGSPTSLQTFTVTVPVINIGTSTSATSFSVQLLVDGVESSTQTVAAIAPTDTTNVLFTVGPLAAGTRLLSVVVDSDGVVTEGDESNNTAQQVVTILAQALLEVGTPITDLSASTDVEFLFAFEHTADNSSIEFSLVDGEVVDEEDADIYVSYGSPPQAPLGLDYVGEPSLGTCKGITPDTNETCFINDAQTGTYHIRIHAFKTFSGVTLSVTTGLEVQTFNIELVFLNAGSSVQRDAFETAAEQWEKILPLDISDLPFNLDPQPAGSCGIPSLPAIDDNIDDLRIYVDLDSIDGPGDVLGRAGVCFVRISNKLPVVGFMEFDTADLSALEANLRLEAVILHEMGHVLGIGTVWGSQFSELLRNPSFPSSPGVDTYFAGPLAIAAFNAAGGTAYSGEKVPVENTAKAGQADGHWRESVLGNELMTPLLEFAPKLSAISIQSLADIGYPVDVSQAVPYVVPGLAAVLRAGPVIDLTGDVWTGPIVGVNARGKVKIIRR
jgi:hypothetical protein